MIRLAILSSTRGTDMLAIIAAIEQGHLNAALELVISNKADALVLERAKAKGVENKFLSPKDLTREQYDALITAECLFRQIDLIVLIGYMRILSDEFVNKWRGKVINVHPSLLPEFAGGMDQNVHEAVLAAGKKTTGCTVHFVTTEIDGGPILVQKSCEVFPDDSIEKLKTRVQALEGEALIEAINKIIANALV